MVETAVGGDESGAWGATAAEIHREMMASYRKEVATWPQEEWTEMLRI